MLVGRTTCALAVPETHSTVSCTPFPGASLFDTESVDTVAYAFSGLATSFALALFQSVALYHSQRLGWGREGTPPPRIGRTASPSGTAPCTGTYQALALS